MPPTCFQGSAFGLYIALSSLVLIHMAVNTNFFVKHFPHLNSVQEIRYNAWAYDAGANQFELHSVIYLQTSIIGQALIFVTRSRYLSYFNRPSLLLGAAFIIAQLVATFIAVYADWGFTKIRGCGWCVPCPPAPSSLLFQS